jgi:predicted GIY-YIG superfamily endonuclease
MWYVYILRSITSPEQEYIGASEEPKQRLADHNAGSTHRKIQTLETGLVLRLPG